MAKLKVDKTNAKAGDMLEALAVDLVGAFSDSIIFKGGFILLKRFPEKGRTTYDIDIDLLKKEIYPEIIRITERWADRIIESGDATRYEHYEATDIKCGKFMLFRDRNIVCSLDIEPNGVDVENVLFEAGGYTVKATTLEQAIVDKLSTFCARTRFRRAKDIYDIWAITESTKIDLRKIYKIIQETKPLVIEDPHPFSDESIVFLRRSYEAVTLNDPKYDKGRVVKKPSFEEVMERMVKVIEALLDVPNLKEDDDGMW